MRLQSLDVTFALLAALTASIFPDVASATISPEDCARSIKFTIQADVYAANCTDVKGDVVVLATAPGNITFDKLSRIHGDLRVEGCSEPNCAVLGGIYAPNLTTIDGRLHVQNVSSLQTISLPQLRNVSGDVNLLQLPALNLLNLLSINRVGSFHLVSAPSLRRAQIGAVRGVNTDPSVGLKNITGRATGAGDAVVEVRDAALISLNGLIDFWDAKLLAIENLFNLQRQMIRVRSVDEVRVVGNGNMSLYFWEKDIVEGTPGPRIKRLRVSGVRHVSPCLQPVVHEFEVFNNSGMDYLHFNFDELHTVEVRDNPRLKKIASWARLNRFWTDISIHDNPMLALSQFPRRATDDNLTAYDCPEFYNAFRDQWAWFPNTFNSVVVSADIDNTFFNETFTNLYLNASSPDNIKPKVMDEFMVSSSNSSFDCSSLNILRSQKGAFPGKYSCQGQTVPAGLGARGLERSSGLTLCLVLTVGMLFLC